MRDTRIDDLVFEAARGLPGRCVLFEPSSEPGRAELFAFGGGLEDWSAAGQRAEDLIWAEFANRAPLTALRTFLHRASLRLEAGSKAVMIARDPDLYPDEAWPGELIASAPFEGEFARPWRHYLELGRLFPLRWKTPRRLESGADGDQGLFVVEFEKIDLDLRGGFHDPKAETNPITDAALAIEQRYGAQSEYRRFDRLEEPEILDDLLWAVSKFRLQSDDAVLSLGCNDGRELDAVRTVAGTKVRLFGVDHSKTAIDEARRRFPAGTFFTQDLEDLSALEIPECRGVLILNTLQCQGIDREALLRSTLKTLGRRGSVLVSVPNCHQSTRDILRRPLDRSDPRHDRAIVQKDVRYLTRYFFRAGFTKVENFGTYDAFVLARR